MTVTLSRRRAITVLAATAGLPLLLQALPARARVIRWEGTALGAPASIQLYHDDEAHARAAIDAGLAELARLESIFSVYRADSAISRLNRSGELAQAPAELIELTSHALKLAQITDGVYDPTVQPLWQLYFRHFTSGSGDEAGPAAAEIAAAQQLVDWRALLVDAGAGSIRFGRPGMGLTLNSGGQGYITDRVTDVLASYGFGHMVVDMGEPRAVSTKPDGSAWRIGIANPADASQAVTEIDVVDKCVATSGGYGTLFDPEGRFTHIIDPASGQTAPRLLGVSVVAARGMVADGLATALVLAPEAKRQEILRAAGAEQALWVTPEGVQARVFA